MRAASARKSSSFVFSRYSIQSAGRPERPALAPQIAQAMAPIVSVSPPMFAHMIAASFASRHTHATASAAVTDSLVIVPVPRKS